MARRSCIAVLAALVFAGCETAVPSPGPSEQATDPIAGDVVAFPGSTRLYVGLAVGSGFIIGGQRQFAEGGLERAEVWTSPDGRSWEPATAPDGSFDQSAVSTLVTNGDLVVALGEDRIGIGEDDLGNPRMWRSSDGREWQRINELDADLRALDSFRLAGDPTGFIAWGENAAGAEQILHSEDAIEWTPVDVTAFVGARLSDVAHGPDAYVAVGASDGGDDCRVSNFEPARAWWSSDGITWEAAEIDRGAELILAVPLADGFFAVGTLSGCGTESTERGYWHSDDGRSWSLVREERSFMEVFSSDGTRVVAWERAAEDFSWSGPGNMQVSLDGLAWQSMGIVDTEDLVSDTFVAGRDGILLILWRPERSEAGVQFIPYGCCMPG